MSEDATFAISAERAARFACGMLGWRPGEFWGSTPAELVTAVRGVVGETQEGALGSGELAALKERFPDG